MGRWPRGLAVWLDGGAFVKEMQMRQEPMGGQRPQDRPGGGDLQGLEWLADEAERRLARSPHWPVIAPRLARWVAIVRGASPGTAEESRVASVLRGAVADDASSAAGDPLLAAAEMLRVVADAVAGPAFRHRVEREVWYPDEGCRMKSTSPWSGLGIRREA